MISPLPPTAHRPGFFNKLKRKESVLLSTLSFFLSKLGAYVATPNGHSPQTNVTVSSSPAVLVFWIFLGSQSRRFISSSDLTYISLSLKCCRITVMWSVFTMNYQALPPSFFYPCLAVVLSRRRQPLKSPILISFASSIGGVCDSDESREFGFSSGLMAEPLSRTLQQDA